MGQLEKYGLYVLCLLIFLILGVTLWGSGEIGAKEKKARLDSNDLNATAGAKGSKAAQLAKSGPAKSGPAESGPERVGQKPDFRALLKPNDAPRKAPEKKPDTPKPGVGGGTVTTEPIVTPPVTPPATRQTHEIVRGDSFERVALQRLGDRRLFVEIARLNPNVDPRKMLPGQKLQLPTGEEVERFLSKRGGTARPAVVAGTAYVITKGDTFDGIARRLLGASKRAKEIQQLNPGVDPTNLKIGSTIRLPKK